MNNTLLTEKEYAPFYKGYIHSLGEVELIPVLESSKIELLKTLENIAEDKLLFRYAQGKWTIKEILQHIIDAERILTYRALRFSRNDTTALNGYDEDSYVTNANGNNRAFSDLINEFSLVREATIAMYKSFTINMLQMQGTANKCPLSVRALGFIIAGHQMHHLKIIIEKYL